MISEVCEKELISCRQEPPNFIIMTLFSRFVKLITKNSLVIKIDPFSRLKENNKLKYSLKKVLYELKFYKTYG